MCLIMPEMWEAMADALEAAVVVLLLRRRVIGQFWADDRVLWAEEPDHLEAVLRAISARSDNSHKLWTDDYLAAFQATGAVLATLDTKLKDRYPSVQNQRGQGSLITTIATHLLIQAGRRHKGCPALGRAR